jgi:thiol:disulfide interchange protein DsbC
MRELPQRSTGVNTMRAFLLACLLAMSFAAQANEDAVRKAFEAKVPGVKVMSVTKTPYGGLWEVFTQNNAVHYTDEAVSFIIFGNLIDTKTNQNVTQLRLRKLTGINLKDLPLDMAIKKVRGKGERVLMVFSDPSCPYCKRLERDIAKMDNITVYVFLYPVEKNFPGTTNLSKSIWCSYDKAKAWDDWMLKGVRPTAAPKCRTPVEALDKIGNKLGIIGTPTLIFGDGAVTPEYVQPEQLERLLNETPR